VSAYKLLDKVECTAQERTNVVDALQDMIGIMRPRDPSKKEDEFYREWKDSQAQVKKTLGAVTRGTGLLAQKSVEILQFLLGDADTISTPLYLFTCSTFGRFFFFLSQNPCARRSVVRGQSFWQPKYCLWTRSCRVTMSWTRSTTLRPCRQRRSATLTNCVCSCLTSTLWRHVAESMSLAMS